MSEFSYYQFRKKHGYSVFVRFEDSDFEKSFIETLGIVGFDSVSREEVKSIELNPSKTKILRVVRASNRIAKKIMTPQLGDSRYGQEQLSQVGAYSVYCYQGTGMMIYGDTSLMWELGIKNTSNQAAIRTMLIRYLSFAFAEQSVVGFWGVAIQEGFVAMTPKEANFEAIFIDINKKLVLTFEGEHQLSSECHVLRLDDAIQSEPRLLNAEELLSFLSMKTTFISPLGMRPMLRTDVWEVAQTLTGFIYPSKMFQPRNQEAA